MYNVQNAFTYFMVYRDDKIIAIGVNVPLLCNQNFIYKRIISILVYTLLHSNKGSIYFLYPLTSLPKMVKQEVPTSIKQNGFFVLRPSVGPPLFSVINKKGECLLSWVLLLS